MVRRKLFRHPAVGGINFSEQGTEIDAGVIVGSTCPAEFSLMDTMTIFPVKM
jgi:hypothetical protein